MMEEKFERVGKAILAELAGEKRLFMYSLRVARDIMERADTEDEIGDAAYAANRMMEAGARYAKSNGYDCPAPLTEEQVLDLCDFGDYETITEIIMTATEIGGKTEVASADGDGSDEKNAQGAKPEI